MLRKSRPYLPYYHGDLGSVHNGKHLSAFFINKGKGLKSTFHRNAEFTYIRYKFLYPRFHTDAFEFYPHPKALAYLGLVYIHLLIREKAGDIYEISRIQWFREKSGNFYESSRIWRCREKSGDFYEIPRTWWFLQIPIYWWFFTEISRIRLFREKSGDFYEISIIWWFRGKKSGDFYEISRIWYFVKNLVIFTKSQEKSGDFFYKSQDSGDFLKKSQESGYFVKCLVIFTKSQ